VDCHRYFLLQYVIQCAGRNVILLLSCDSHAPNFDGMFELPVAATCCNMLLPITLQQLDDFADCGRHSLNLPIVSFKANATLQTDYGGLKKWCCQRESDSRPLPYQGSALPLSYGSDAGMAVTCHNALPSATVLARACEPARLACMTEEKAKSKRVVERKNRQAAALKANLKRRKAPKPAENTPPPHENSPKD
jgi:hypothetical protein